MFKQKIITNTHSTSTKTQLTNGLTKKAVSAKELLYLLQKRAINK